MKDEIKIYGAIELQNNPWNTTIWKDILTKDEILTMSVLPYSNVCDGSELADAQLINLFKSQSLSTRTLDEIIFRSLLLHMGKDSVFGLSFPKLDPLNCINYIISTVLGDHFLFFHHYCSFMESYI